MAFETWKSFRTKKDLRHELQMQRYLIWLKSATVHGCSLYILLVYRFQEDHLVAKLTDRWIANASATTSSAYQSKFNPLSPLEGFRHCSVSKFSGIFKNRQTYPLIVLKRLSWILSTTAFFRTLGDTVNWKTSCCKRDEIHRRLWGCNWHHET